MAQQSKGLSAEAAGRARAAGELKPRRLRARAVREHVRLHAGRRRLRQDLRVQVERAASSTATFIWQASAGRSMRSWVMLLVVAASLGGCADTEEPDVQAVPEDEPAGPSESANGTLAEAVNTLPELAFNASQLNGTVPFDVVLWINATDAEGDALAWNLTQGNQTLATGSTVPANHTVSIVEPGSHRFTLNLTDGNGSVERHLTVVATETLPLVVDLEDPSGDGAHDVDALDITHVFAEVSGGKLLVTVTVVDLPTGTDTPSFVPWKYRLYVGDHQFQNFNYVGPDIWDSSNGEYIGGATWDPGADTVGFSIDVSRLDGLELTAPYPIRLETATGNLSLTPHVTVDWAPDDGPVLVG